MARKYIDTPSGTSAPPPGPGSANSPRPLSNADSTSIYDTATTSEDDIDDDDTHSLSNNSIPHSHIQRCSSPNGSSDSDTDQPTPVARTGPSFGNNNTDNNKLKVDSKILGISSNPAVVASSDSDNNNSINNRSKNKKPASSASALRKTSAPQDQGTMTVETETVPAVGTIGVSSSGSLRVEKSTDNVNKTIRNKKRPHRLPQLSYSSKADLFAAKVASAVDQADSPDSDETFVYESNPSEFQSRRGQSRNPSTTSLGTSMNEPPSSDGFLSLNGARRNINNNNNNNYNSINSNGGTPRISSSSRSGVNPRKKPSTHSLRVYTSNRNAGAPGSPTFLQTGSSKYRHSRIASRGGLRTPADRRNFGDINDDDNDDADTETDPLMAGAGPIRMQKRRGQNYRNASQLERDSHDGNANATFSNCAKLGICMLLGISLALLLGFTFGFVVASNKPLKQVHITNVTDILVSEDELMFDLTVRAFNPGFLTVNVRDLDLNVFARPSNPVTIDDDDDDKKNGPEHYLLLGQILHFDTSLTFEGGFFNRRSHSSRGAVRLPKPGNKTEENGPEKWAKLIRHSFDLNLRGVLVYKLPISKTSCSNELSQTVKVDPHQLDQNL